MRVDKEWGGNGDDEIWDVDGRVNDGGMGRGNGKEVVEMVVEEVENGMRKWGEEKEGGNE